LAAKILMVNSVVAREALRNRIAFVRSLPLEGVPIATPIDSLAPPHVGYTMQLLRDMVPASVLTRPDNTTKCSLNQWYAKTGGSARRLRLMAKACDILSEVHALGLCYGDVSPRNVFVSGRGADAQVWFIDADNLCYLNHSERLKIYTPGYGAPEIVSGHRGASTLGDSHAMAVLAFQCLTLAHPLIGDAVNDGDPEMEEKAFAGELPWIEDELDSSNHSSQGIPRNWVLSPRLRKTFSQFFGPGLKDQTARPGVTTLAHALHGAADFTLRCPQCTQYFIPQNTVCPWCRSARPPFLVLRGARWEPKNGVVKLAASEQGTWPGLTLPHVVIPYKQVVTLTARVMYGQTGRDGNMPVLRISSDDGAKVTFEKLGEFKLFISPKDSSRFSEISENNNTVPIGGAEIHSAGVDVPHRVFEIVRP